MGKRPRDRAFDAATSLMTPLARVVERCSLVGDGAILPADQFAWTRLLEEHWREIRAELDAVLVDREELPAFHEIAADVSDISTDRDWKTFFFYGYGFRSDVNLARCPTTARLLDQVPGLTTAFFSILEPGKHIAPHRGIWKGVLRYHLGLIIPEPPEACGIRVGAEEAHWREGESLVFDDTYEHTAWNDTAATRVVLFLDVKRPCRFPGSWINSAVIRIAAFSPFVQDGRRKHREWERRYALKHSA
ncbi:MAG TPA: aspartyl/asparaginyl beta-hydroxylase domain-containing protein [Candidatus Dormibacteraeota bacterium]